jgi:hypothetical protein
MRPAYFMLALAATACSVSASAADVEFEVDSKVFEQRAVRRPEFTVERGEFPILKQSYDHPIYEGLWPMTLAAFRQSEETKDVEIFTFNIASNDEELRRCLTVFSPKFFPAYDSPLFSGIWPMTREAFQKLDTNPQPVEHQDFSFPEAEAEDGGMVLAAIESRDLRSSLWKATRDKFESMDNGVVFGRFTR